MSTISTRKTILIVPLDWGLGHATRDIPLIHELLNAGCKVVIAAEGKHAALLQQEFPELTMLSLPGYRIEYAQKGWFFGWKIIQQIPKILNAIKFEQQWLEKVVVEHQIDAVISDNRFGLYHSKIPTVFISHQLLIKTPFGGFIEKWLQALNYRYINRYSACWIPDYADAHNLSGILAHPSKLPPHTTYLGCLSRFEDRTDVKQQYDLLVLISGPEPQRSNLEKMILDQIGALQISALIVSGKPGTPEKKQIAPGVQQVNHMNAKELNEAMLASKMVLSRSGYTTLMDLVKLNKKAILIPTPGQSEQEYLGKFLMKKGYFYNIPQHTFDLKNALEAADKFEFKSFEHEQDMEQYKDVVRKWVNQLQTNN